MNWIAPSLLLKTPTTIAGGLFSLHVIGKLRSGDTGSLSVSLIEKIGILSKKLSDLPAFSELVTQYSQRGYIDGKELYGLILSDLYYHLQGELEGRKIDHGLFKEFSQYLVESKFYILICTSMMETFQLKPRMCTCLI